jgi:hypothetical protein
MDPVATCLSGAYRCFPIRSYSTSSTGCMETSVHTWEPGILVHLLSVTLSLVSHSGAAADFVTFDLVHTSTPSITTFLPPVEIKSDTHCFT